MAKKTEGTEEKKITFARPSASTNLSMGIVGFPNVGKSTLFNRLTKCSVPAENYPFCTINPSVGQVKINDPRLTFLAEFYKPKRVVPAFLTVTDIAGLVKGASEGHGLGNQFLDHIRSTDGIFMVVRCFEDTEVPHVESSVDPIRDIQIIRDELRVKDAELLEKALVKAEKDVRAKPGDKKVEKAANTIRKLIRITETSWINEDPNFDADELAVINKLNLLTTKSVVYLANISERHYRERKCNKHLKAVIERYRDSVIPFSATYVVEGTDGELPCEFVDKLVAKGYESLELMNFFTAGKDEVRSWTIRKGSKTPAAGAAIHTDFEKYFVSADVMEYDEFVKHPGEAAMRAVGKYMQKGKDYTVKDGDIIFFKANPPRGGK